MLLQLAVKMLAIDPNYAGFTYGNCHVKSSYHTENIESQTIITAANTEQGFIRKLMLDMTLDLPGVAESNVSKADRTPNEEV